MLPELFKGNTMQEDYGFFNTSNCLNEKVVTSSGASTAPIFIDFDTKSNSPCKETEIASTLSENNSSPEINKWPFNYGINFLKTSDDPMISSVYQESGCNENELFKRNSSMNESSPSPKPSFEITSSEDVTFVSEMLPKPKRKSNLQFHNQLFSQDQYSNSSDLTQQYHKSNEKRHKSQSRDKSSPKPESAVQSQVEEEEGVISWLQKMMLKTNSSHRKKKISPKTPSYKKTLPKPDVDEGSCYLEDQYPSLPFMGQMTLENMKPRRGRKPKKASSDICHLIYKNYGTIVSRPNYASSNISSTTTIKSLDSNSNKPSTAKSAISQSELKNKPSKILQTEPLNLCVREKLKKNSLTEDCQLKMMNPEDISRKKVNYAKEKLFGVSLPTLNPNEIDDTEKLDSTTKSIQHHMILDPIYTDNDACYTELLAANQCSNTDPSSTTSHNACHHQKRKRSAIFIPPVQTQCSTSNPTNEVSICKFKFTGGTKPSLQEKKILSVDAGGNFRYFSGTGDKSMRGYEFFPRENLLKSSMSAQSHTNAFLNAASQKLPLDFLPPISPDINNKLLNLTDVDSTGTLDKNLVDASEISSSAEKDEEYSDFMLSPNRKRPVVNRSVQRRKLEKTFKEKGFLIQTQQLQSAEGATYCKFRQLRKFTRYLFRSWKDYLPPCEAKPEGS